MINTRKHVDESLGAGGRESNVSLLKRHDNPVSEKATLQNCFYCWYKLQKIKEKTKNAKLIIS